MASKATYVAGAAPHSATGTPPGSPVWVTPDLIARTVATWQPHYSEPLTPEVALEILLAAGRLLDALVEDVDEEALSGPRSR